MIWGNEDRIWGWWWWWWWYDDNNK